MQKSYDELIQELKQHNQQHVLQFYNELSPSEQETLRKQLSMFDISLLNQIFESSTSPSTSSTATSLITPPPKSCIDSVLHHDIDNSLFNEGLQLIANNQVGVVLLAGGQGTRLGSKDPKGIYDLKLLSGKTLFQIQSERIVKLQQLASPFASNRQVIIPFYILVCDNFEQTRDYFIHHNYFGLRSDQVYFFSQDMLPCFSLDGKLILETKSSLALAPNGNGDVYQALLKSGCLDDMKKRGVQYIHSYSVDNVLVKVADPVFMAFCANRKAEFGSKVIPKRHAHEKVGVFALKDNKFDVVEYSEISKEMAERIDEQTGELAFNAANIVNFFYSLEFLYKCAEIMKTHNKYHVAKKTMDSVNERGEIVQVQGIKIELFNFDICPFADQVALLEVDRTFEFSPLKNAPNENLQDSPETCRRDLTNAHALFVERAGGRIEGDLSTQLFEISPLVTYGGEGLESIVKSKTYVLPHHLHHQ
jgi:UDP-N-acetylglucosamine/UDP-N-acetylgalactosamine diphosphorylase